MKFLERRKGQKGHARTAPAFAEGEVLRRAASSRGTGWIPRGLFLAGEGRTMLVAGRGGLGLLFVLLARSRYLRIKNK